MVSGRKGIGSRLAKSGSGKKSKAVVGYGRTRRSTASSKTPTDHYFLRTFSLYFCLHSHSND